MNPRLRDTPAGRTAILFSLASLFTAIEAQRVPLLICMAIAAIAWTRWILRDSVRRKPVTDPGSLDRKRGFKAMDRQKAKLQSQHRLVLPQDQEIRTWPMSFLIDQETKGW